MTTGLAAGTYKLFIGIDIAAATAEVSTQRPGAKASRSFTMDQTPQGFTCLVNKLQATGCEPSQVLVVMEATGSYWISLATRLVHEGFRVSSNNSPPPLMVTMTPSDYMVLRSKGMYILPDMEQLTFFDCPLVN